MTKLSPYFAVDAYEKDAAVSKYTLAIDKVGLWNSEKKIISNYVKKESNILELGCGAGRVAINLYKFGYKNITGIDLSAGMIQAAQNYVKENSIYVNFKVDDAMNLKFDDKTFECVLFMFNGLMLIPGIENRIKVLSEVRRVLKEQGTFIFTSHDINGNKEYKKFWDEQKSKWIEGQNDKKLYEYGDLIDSEIDENDSFIHFPEDNEIYEMAKAQNFKIVYSNFRDIIEEENDNVKEFSGNTKFWVLKKMSL